ncbi:NAD-dependent epimerase/dehydratase family protein [Acidaminococcus sp. NSJ-142]|jgi:UDP-glucose 4-epimerase|uniref:NAD-dependent epimerase/dehydratase family protein n=1 Tax=Acidaminococcus TaxID=904 RepID=UPI000CFA3FDC|nr:MULTISPECIES: NAD-dependent epimerase/dehydratase family protein [Acidaminococcus]MCD2435534.1 NAD-dependent epimerase/dehydratase family protein [Acidaminococcus hominis]MCH4095522.1 NAD-dependent epimerase/dehydratase family protein [Acidaminococcus provencensis]RHK01813.1 NAD-dependent epimerase/dehydratase family protein [Acidaminococcus sp. AM05-11]
MTNILVTGGAGFIGSHVVALLLKQGYEKVCVLDNLSTGKKENVPAAVPLEVLDIRSPELEAFLQKQQFDVVIHLAAQTMVPFSMAHPDLDEAINISGMVHLLEGCRKSGVKKIIFSSSAAIYGDNQNLPLKETEAPAPTSFYGLTKAAGEQYIRLYEKAFGLKGIIFRFANVYGERQGETGEGGVISIFAQKIAKQEAVSIFGDGNQTRDFVYAGDIARAIVLGVGYEGSGTFNVSTNQEVSLNQLIAALEKVTGKKLQVNYGPVRPGDIYASVLSHQAIVEKLNMTEFTPLEQGLAKTMAYFQRQYGK